jgi:exopolyphosphatase / guanosine-5'-triphosphate,3'-diphosphate pyrophosphatase
MRMGVIDAGSNTVRLVVAEMAGQVPQLVHTAKWPLRLAERLGPDRRLGDAEIRDVTYAVAEAVREARRHGGGEPCAFATAVIRDAPNRSEICRAVEEGTGVTLKLLPGKTEAELTFLAARRWMGWRAGPLGLLDIGGGSLEVACGQGVLPDFAVSLPLGAGRLTGEFFADHDVPSAKEVKVLRRHVRNQLEDTAARLRRESPRTTVVTSRTFQQLARLCAEASGQADPSEHCELTRKALRRAVRQLRRLPPDQRARLPGISRPRARQSLAGAVVAHEAMRVTASEVVTVCPWAIREGVLLRAIENDGARWWAGQPDHGSENVRPGHQPSRAPHGLALSFAH